MHTSFFSEQKKTVFFSILIIIAFWVWRIFLPCEVVARTIDRTFYVFIDTSKTVSNNPNVNIQDILPPLVEIFADNDRIRFDDQYDTLYIWPFSKKVQVEKGIGKKDTRWFRTLITTELRKRLNEKQRSGEHTNKSSYENDYQTDLVSLFKKINEIIATDIKLNGNSTQYVFLVISDFLHSKDTKRLCDYTQNDLKNLRSEVEILIRNTSHKNIHFTFFKLDFLDEDKKSTIQSCIDKIEKNLWQPIEIHNRKESNPIKIETINNRNYDNQNKRLSQQFIERITREAHKNSEKLCEPIDLYPNIEESKYDINLGILNLSIRAENPNFYKIALSEFTLNHNNSGSALTLHSKDLPYEIPAKGQKQLRLSIEKNNWKNRAFILNFKQNPRPAAPTKTSFTIQLPEILPYFSHCSINTSIRNFPINLILKLTNPNDLPKIFQGKSCVNFFNHDKFKKLYNFQILSKDNLISTEKELKPSHHHDKLQIKFSSPQKDIPTNHIKLRLAAGLFTKHFPNGKKEKTNLFILWELFDIAEAPIYIILVIFLLPFAFIISLNFFFPMLDQTNFFAAFIVPIIFGTLTIFDQLNPGRIVENTYHNIIGFIPIVSFVLINWSILHERRYLFINNLITEDYKRGKTNIHCYHFIYFFLKCVLKCVIHQNSSTVKNHIITGYLIWLIVCIVVICWATRFYFTTYNCNISF